MNFPVESDIKRVDIGVKFSLWGDNKVDVEWQPFAFRYDARLTLETSVSFFDQLIWYQILVFHLPTDTAPQFFLDTNVSIVLDVRCNQMFISFNCIRSVLDWSFESGQRCIRSHR